MPQMCPLLDTAFPLPWGTFYTQLFFLSTIPSMAVGSRGTFSHVNSALPINPDFFFFTDEFSMGMTSRFRSNPMNFPNFKYPRAGQGLRVSVPSFSKRSWYNLFQKRNSCELIVAKSSPFYSAEARIYFK